ncbi:MAG: RluA family pseudouridine synthase [Armatimonadota bacterium]
MTEGRTLTVEPAESGMRLDAFIAGRSIGLTRSQAERLARAGAVMVGGRPAAPARKLVAGETVLVPPPACRPRELEPEKIPLEILFEDEDLIVVNKPRGMVVHPGLGHDSGTLVHALLGHTRSLATGSASYRPGLVHRLDRDTSGLLVVAKTDEAYAGLTQQVRDREVERRYLALAWGKVREDRIVVEVPIGRHERDPKRMAAVAEPAEGRKLRQAHTDLAVIERYGPMTLMEAKLGTGRMHQVRVHMAHIGHPVVGDPVYGVRQARLQKVALPPETLALVEQLGGQALHAHSLRFTHPRTGQSVSFSAPMPQEMARLVAHLAAAKWETAGEVPGEEGGLRRSAV